MTDTPRSVVIGTAGHIDHGKTTLVGALTGIDTDRLPQEKRRGITIDLGFASFEMQAPDQSRFRISFVDVPGHSLFIRNMLAGAGSVPAVMLVIAANEGVKPQTVEHLAICNLLGITQGITVITKTDAVNAIQLEEVMRSIEMFLQESFLDKSRAPLLPVSASTGEGLETVRAELLKLAMRIQAERSDAMLRMPLDRSFVMQGFGTVVSGTLLSGTIHDGQTLHLEPGKRAVRVRGLQTHGQPQQSARSGWRVAVNLSGVDASQVHRGQTLVSPGTLSPVDTIDAEISLLHSASALKHRTNVHFHAFTAETMARISLFGYEALRPGTVRLARIRLSEPIVLVPGDRFVLRQSSPAGTIGGGCVLDAHPDARQRKAATFAWLEQLRTSSLIQQIVLRVRRRETNGINLDTLAAETGLTSNAVRRHISSVVERGDLLLISDDTLLKREAFLASCGAILAQLQGGRTVKSSELRSQMSFSPRVFEFVMTALIKEEKIRVLGEMVSTFDVEARSSNGNNEQLRKIAEEYMAAGLVSPSVLDLAKKYDIQEAEMRRLITLLQRGQTIVRMGSDDLFIHSDALQKLIAQIVPLKGSLMDVARFKQLTGLSRKYAIPLLEYLDRQRITRKQGDQRLIL